MKKDFLRLEQEVLVKLNFDVQHISPIAFLERLKRLFNLDLDQDNKQQIRIAVLAHELCKKMLRHSEFLRFRPS